MFLSELFSKFLKEKEFLCNVSPKTVRSYKQAFNAYPRVLSKFHHIEAATSVGTPPPITKDTLKDFVIGRREEGLSPGACNVYIRSINSFLSWLHTGYVTEPLRLRQLPQPKTVVKANLWTNLFSIYEIDQINSVTICQKPPKNKKAERRAHGWSNSLLLGTVRSAKM